MFTATTVLVLGRDEDQVRQDGDDQLQRQPLSPPTKHLHFEFNTRLRGRDTADRDENTRQHTQTIRDSNPRDPRHERSGSTMLSAVLQSLISRRPRPARGEEKRGRWQGGTQSTHPRLRFKGTTNRPTSTHRPPSSQVGRAGRGLLMVVAQHAPGGSMTSFLRFVFPAFLCFFASVVSFFHFQPPPSLSSFPPLLCSLASFLHRHHLLDRVHFTRVDPCP